MLPDGPCLGLAVHLHRSQCTYRCVVLPDEALVLAATEALWVSQCTYRCVVLPDEALVLAATEALWVSQCTYRCVVLPDTTTTTTRSSTTSSLNAPTGAWCSLTSCKQGPCLGYPVSMHLQVRGAP